jgi:membrane protease YdiL (CAAX protease family)
MTWFVIAGYMLAVACGLVAVRQWLRRGIPVWRGMGLRLDKGAWVDLGGGIAIGTSAMAGVFGVECALGVVQVRGVQLPDLGWAVWLPGLVFLALGEEIAYRSLMLSGFMVLLRRRWLALIGMATLFGLAHAGNPNASPLSVLGNALGGLVYGVAFLGSGRIWLPLGVHFAWNFVQSPLLGFPLLGKEIGLLQQTSMGNALITGGDYGPEAGLVGMAFRFVAIALLLGWLRWRSRMGLGRDVASSADTLSHLADEGRSQTGHGAAEKGEGGNDGT